MYINCLKCVQCQIYFSVNYLPLMIVILLDKLVVVQQIRFLKFWVTVVFITVLQESPMGPEKISLQPAYFFGGQF
jgi:hypothetical protein